MSRAEAREVLPADPTEDGGDAVVTSREAPEVAATVLVPVSASSMEPAEPAPPEPASMEPRSAEAGPPAPETPPEEADSAPAPAPTELLIRRPADGGIVGIMPIDPVAMVEASVIRSRAAAAGWRTLTLGERVRRMVTLRREIGRRADEIADRIAAETGRPEDEALAELLAVMRLLRHLERTAPKVLGPRRARTGWFVRASAEALRAPVGVVGVLTPWTHPFLFPMGATAAALFGGNGVVLKPSERTPFTGALIPDLCQDAGLPEDLVLAVQGDRSIGEALVDACPDHLHLIGSPDAGRDVLRRAAPHLIHVTLELGGMGTAIVLDDADPARTARGIAWAAFRNGGQSAFRIERVYVEERIYDKFTKNLVNITNDLRVGNGGNVEVGPIVAGDRLEGIEEQLADAVRRGARVLCGGMRADPASNILLPTILADVPDGARILEEETLAPVLPIVPVPSAEEAVFRMNRERTGRHTSIWTGSARRGRALARHVEAGSVSVNEAAVHPFAPALPGGAMTCGWGSMWGTEGLLTFTTPRSFVMLRGGRDREPWRFPYGTRARNRIRALLGWERHRGFRGLVAAFVRYISKEVR